MDRQLEPIPQNTIIKEQELINYIKDKNLFSSKVTMNKVKKQVKNKEKCLSHAHDKWLISRTCK